MTAQQARRRPGQLREDIVAAAGTLFVQRGFDGTSMRDIAAETRTSQAMLYRYFPSKVAVFEAAVSAPFQDFLDGFLQEWKAHTVSDLPNRELFVRFNERLYDVALENRKMILALLSADAFAGDAVGDLAGMLVNGLPELVSQLEAEKSSRGWDGVDMQVGARAVIAMVVGTALLGDWLFGSERERIGRQRILAELTELELTGTMRTR